MIADVNNRAINLHSFSMLYLDIREHGQCAAESGVAEGEEPLSVGFHTIRLW